MYATMHNYGTAQRQRCECLKPTAYHLHLLYTALSLQVKSKNVAVNIALNLNYD